MDDLPAVRRRIPVARNGVSAVRRGNRRSVARSRPDTRRRTGIRLRYWRRRADRAREVAVGRRGDRLLCQRRGAPELLSARTDDAVAGGILRARRRRRPCARAVGGVDLGAPEGYRERWVTRVRRAWREMTTASSARC